MITIKITTFELVDDDWKETVTHLFHGEDKEQALGNLRAHRKTDTFFDASFAGNFKGMILKNSEPELIEDN